MRAFWRRNVDLPAMFGPVKSQIVSAVPFRLQSFATKTAEDCTLSAASTTGWRPCDTLKLRLLFKVGLTQPPFIASSAKPEDTSISAIAVAKACRCPACSKTELRRFSKISNSSSVAFPAAFKILVSSSPKSMVVKRTALAVVWR